MFKKLRYQLLTIFISYSLLALVMMLIAISFNSRKEKLSNITQNLQHVKLLIVEDQATMNQFFAYETQNPEYYIKNKSPYIKHHHDLIDSINVRLTLLDSANAQNPFDQNQILDSTSTLLNEYNSHIIKILYYIKVKGFKESGLEGEMDYYISSVAAYLPDFAAKIYALRCDEKDFLATNDMSYAQNLLKKSDELISWIQKDANLNQISRDSALYCLQNYRSSFDSLTSIESKTGLKNNSGLKRKIDQKEQAIKARFDILLNDVENKNRILIRKIQNTSITIGLIIICIAILLSFAIARRITHRISKLSELIAEFVGEKFSPKIEISLKVSNDEVGQLIHNFSILRNSIVDLIGNFEAKVEQQTAEVIRQKDLIEQQNEEMTAQNDQLVKTNHLLEKQKELVDEQNRYTMDSIRYAGKIQQAILPDVQQISSVFPDSFVYYQPKDIISGDFYWTKEICNERFNIQILVIADCTGHGVPGALMSMLGIAYLNEIVMQKQVTQASHILDLLKEKVTNSLAAGNGDTFLYDGMDMGVCIFHKNTRKMEFAGANRPLYIVRNKEIIQYQGNNCPIGKHTAHNKAFSNHEINVEANDVIYLFSDGYYHQFGGPEKRKFMKHRFRQLLREIATLPCPAQQNVLESTLNQWKSDLVQVDDILVAGIRIGAN
jgi:serine phosphatase RsbU (regulator of sigma subunit)